METKEAFLSIALKPKINSRENNESEAAVQLSVEADRRWDERTIDGSPLIGNTTLS